ncbi:hypothetical protein KY320_00985, partial [Candidatus Woesearchaeota archaeon]|nr:hypothetical protein [Candidatus Woesearchaeota archaeon]
MKALDTTMDSEAKTKRKSTKKAYVYTLDAAIAVLIMLLGLTLLYYRFMANPIETYYVEFLSEDAVGVLSYTKI